MPRGKCRAAIGVPGSLQRSIREEMPERPQRISRAYIAVQILVARQPHSSSCAPMARGSASRRANARSTTLGRLPGAHMAPHAACHLPRLGEASCRWWWWPAFPQFTFERTTSMINFIVWLVVGGLVGWIASMIMRTDAQQGVILNVVVGIVGAAIAGWLISPLVGVPSINTGFSIGSFVVSLLGAIVLLGIVNLFRRGRMR